MILFVLFIVIPLIEISLFIAIGDEIGIGTTLLLTFVTAVIGAFLVRTQGLATLLSAQSAMGRSEMPVKEIFDGICLAIAGAMLMTPGFFTDTIGFLLLVPPLRDYIRKELPKHIKVQTMGGTYHDPRQDPRRPQEPDVIEVEYERVDDDK